MYTFIGLGLNKRSLVIQLIRLWVVRLGVLYILTYCFDLGADAIIISLTAANVAGAVISHIMYRRIDWDKPGRIR